MDMRQLRVPVSEVRPDPGQPRKYFRKAGLLNLAKSIKAHGQRTPIQVKLLPEVGEHRYEIIDGERRWRACQLGHIETIRISVEEGLPTLQEQHLLSLISNFHREDHTHIEVSNAVSLQVQNGISVATLAVSLGKSEGWVYQYLKLQQLIPELQTRMHPETSERLLLRFSEAVVLASLPVESQNGVYQKMLEVPVKSRLDLARKYAQQITGQTRRGRPRDDRRYIVTFVNRLNADLERVLGMKDADFRKAVDGMSTIELSRLKKAMLDFGAKMAILSKGIDEALMVG